MRKREVLAEFKKTVRSCLENVETYVFDEKDLSISYSYIPKHYIHYNDDYDISYIKIKEGVHGYMISLINRDKSKRNTKECSKTLFIDEMSAE